MLRELFEVEAVVYPTSSERCGRTKIAKGLYTMQVRVGVVGGGVYGTNILKAYSNAARRGDIELVAFADIKEEVVEQQERAFDIKGYLDYREMFKRENLDAVAIVTPDHLHREIAIDAATCGIHMHVQKPLDVTAKGAKEIVQAANENSVLLYVDFHKRFDPAHILLKQSIQKGKLGKIQYGYVWMEDAITVPSIWFKDWAQNSSPAWFIGIHFFDLIYWMMESRPKKVYATAVKDKLAGMGIDTLD